MSRSREIRRCAGVLAVARTDLRLREVDDPRSWSSGGRPLRQLFTALRPRRGSSPGASR